jgi:hypothetical protein
MTGKKMSLKELFDKKAAEMKAFVESPEGKAQHERFLASVAEERALLEAEMAANPQTPFELGQDAALRNEERYAPEDLTEEQQAEWLAGYDHEADDEEA